MRVSSRSRGHLSALPDTQVVDELALQSTTIHGYRRAFRMAGSGPALLLLHGIGDSSQAWLPILPQLARTHTVIAPDLLGHGGSDKPRADYSVAAYANGMRDLLGVLDIDQVTVVGHSLGGGVAMQFAYQFPERTQRLVLVGAGGAGRELNPLLRLVSAPLADQLLALLRLPGAGLQSRLVVEVLRRLGTDIGLDSVDLLRVVAALPDAKARSAFIRTLRGVVDWHGQVVTMLDRCYLAAGMPTLLVWGERDAVVPVEHAYRAHDAMTGSQLVIFEDAGHFPFRTDPSRFVQVFNEFMATTTPATWAAGDWRELLRDGPPGVSDLPRSAHPAGRGLPSVRAARAANAVLDVRGDTERSAT
jgi:pimeloyl-ACP methyl ester carboxylesterase